MNTDAIAAAQHYGWPIIKLSKPTNSGPSPGKRPMGRNWETKPGLSEAEATQWLADGGNIGIRTGGGLLVVDCDGDRPPNLPDTPTVQTGSGGLHLYYRVPDGTTFRHTGNTARWIHPTTDTRYERGQVVAAGSIHAETGVVYEWLPGLSPAEMQLTTLPQWVIDAINNPETPPWHVKPGTPAEPRRAAPVYNHEDRYIAAAVSKAIANVINAPEGQRNHTLNREAFALAGLPGVDATGPLMDAALVSGLTEQESRASIRSGTTAGREKPRQIPDIPAVALATAPAVYAPPVALPMPDGYVTGPSPRELSEKYLSDIHPDGTLRYWRGDWYRYTGTHYARYTHEELHRDLSRIMSGWHYFGASANAAPKPVKTSLKDGLIRDVISQLRGIVLIPPDREVPCWLDGVERPPAKLWIALQNGLLSLLPSRELIPHTPALFNTQALPFDYQPHAESPETWIEFIQNTWPGDAGADCALMLAEWFGYCLSRDMSHHRMLWIIGPTRSGKGVISRILTALLGPASVCSPTLGSLGDRNGGQVLIGMRLAVIGDARLGRRNDKAAIIERLLSISGGDTQTFPRKYLPDWTGQPELKFVMLSNELPSLADESGALLGRLLLLETTQSHMGKEDRFLESRIRRELPAILNWALDGLDRLTVAGRFTEPASSASIIASFRAMSAPLTAFVDECCVVGENHTVECGALYAVYLRWAEEEGITRTYSRQAFGQKLRTVVPSMKRERANDWGSRTWYYCGLKAGND